MTVKVSFVASDGREFATEAECIMHEVKINPEKYEKFRDGVIMLRYMNGLILNGKDDKDSFGEDVHAFYSGPFAVIVFDKEKADAFFKIIRNAGAECPDSEPGIYFLDGFTNRWVRKAVDEYVNLVNTINQKYLESI